MDHQNETIKEAEYYLMRTYGRFPIVLCKGEGPYVWDDRGNRYLDFVSGIAVNSLGHCHPRVVEAIRQQSGQLIHCSNLYYTEQQARLAKKLVEASGLGKAFFCNSGAEAVEAAMKLARKHAKNEHGSQKYEIITALHSFHGRTLAAITATGQPKYQQGFEPLPAGFRYVPFNDIQALKGAISENTCAIMLEPVQGEGGVNVAGHDYLREVRALCNEHEILLIFDEVQTGMGRTGRLFAYEHYGIKPDILALAKALGSGFPIGATLARKEVAQTFKPGDHASTFGGNPLACAAALATLEVMQTPEFLEQVRAKSTLFQTKLWELQSAFPFVKEVRGLGLLVGLELKEDIARELLQGCQKRGLLINAIGANVLRFIPPLIASEKELQEAVEILAASLSETTWPGPSPVV